MSILGANFFSSQWFLIIILVVAVVLLMLLSFSRKKKEDAYRTELSDKVKQGVKVKTYGGLYGTVVSVSETTDGKIVLVATGEGDHISYQRLHINAIYGIDDSQPVVYTADGEPVTEEELKEREQQKLQQVATSVTENKVEEKQVEKPAKKTSKKSK